MEKRRTNNAYFYIALVLGIAMVVVGIVFLGLSTKSHAGTNGYGLSRASTSIEFGGDFYTTSAQYTGLAANTVTDLYAVVSMGIGIFFLFVGGLEICILLLLKSYPFFQKHDVQQSEDDMLSLITGSANNEDVKE